VFVIIACVGEHNICVGEYNICVGEYKICVVSITCVLLS
jgi:hypothetical protein